MSSHSVRVCRFAWRRLRGGGEGSIKMMAVLGKEGRVGQVIVHSYGVATSVSPGPHSHPASVASPSVASLAQCSTIHHTSRSSTLHDKLEEHNGEIALILQ
jgi:hypothetical protein